MSEEFEFGKVQSTKASYYQHKNSLYVASPYILETDPPQAWFALVNKRRYLKKNETPVRLRENEVVKVKGKDIFR